MQLPLLKVIFGVVVGHGCWWLVVGICRVTPWILAIAGLFALGFELSECHDSLERIPDLAPVPAERLPLLVSSFDYSVLLILVLKRREVVLLTALVDLLKAFEVVPEDFDGLVASGSRMAECQMKPRTKGVINRSDRVSGEKTNPRVALEDSQKRQRLGRYCWTSRCCFFFVASRLFSYQGLGQNSPPVWQETRPLPSRRRTQPHLWASLKWSSMFLSTSSGLYPVSPVASQNQI